MTTWSVIFIRTLLSSLSNAFTNLQNSPLTLSSSSGKIKSSSGRVGKTGFIPSNPQVNSKLDTLVTHLRHSAGRAVGLNGDIAESLQVVSYGIGGHYEPHVDYFDTVHKTWEIGHDRLARTGWIG